MEINLFEVASRKAFRFESNKGALTLEQLWTLPLVNSSGTSLDAVAQTLNAQIETSSTKSFVIQKSEADTETVQKLEIVKHIITVKIAEKEAAVRSAENRALRKQFTEALAAKEQEGINSLSADELRKRIAELD